MNQHYYNQYNKATTVIIPSKSNAPQTYGKAKNLDHTMSSKFRKFVEDGWDVNYMYTPNDFIEMFGITRHLSRYYLMELVYERKLYRVKYLNKTWYDKVNDEEMLSKCQEYIWMGVDVTV